MVYGRGFGKATKAAGVTFAALLALAACGSDTPDTPAATTAAATTVAAATATTAAAATTVAATTTTVAVDSAIATIQAMTDCDTLKTLITISTSERDGAKPASKKLYEDRITAAQARQKTLSCPA